MRRRDKYAVTCCNQKGRIQVGTPPPPRRQRWQALGRGWWGIGGQVMPTVRVAFGKRAAWLTFAGHYVPGDQPPTGDRDWQEWANVQHKAWAQDCPRDRATISLHFPQWFRKDFIMGGNHPPKSRPAPWRLAVARSFALVTAETACGSSPQSAGRARRRPSDRARPALRRRGRRGPVRYACPGGARAQGTGCRFRSSAD